MVFQKIRFSEYNCTSKSLNAQLRRKSCQSNSFPILDISIRSGNIRAKSEKQSEIGPKLAFFAPPIFFFGGGQPLSPKKIWTGICKLNMLLTMWQNFAEIGPRTLEISQ